MANNVSSGPLTSAVTYHIEFTGGNFQLFQVKTMSVADQRTGEVVVGGAGPIGSTFSGGGFTGTMEIHRQTTVPDEVSWFELAKSKAEFTISQQDLGPADAPGTRYTWNRCQVTKVDHEGANDGNQTQSVEWITAAEIQITQPEPGA